MISSELREIPVIAADNQVIGMLDETDISEVYLRAANRAESADRATAIVTPPIRH